MKEKNCAFCINFIEWKCSLKKIKIENCFFGEVHARDCIQYKEKKK